MVSELVYTRTGGFAGTSDRVSIKTDGSLESSGRMVGQHAGKLTEAQVRELAELLKDWPHIEITGKPPAGAADYFTLSIAYAGKTVTWTSLTPNVPESVKRLVTRIEELAKSL